MKTIPKDGKKSKLDRQQEKQRKQEREKPKNHNPCVDLVKARQKGPLAGQELDNARKAMRAKFKSFVIQPTIDEQVEIDEEIVSRFEQQDEYEEKFNIKIKHR